MIRGEGGSTDGLIPCTAPSFAESIQAGTASNGLRARHFNEMDTH
jgi:hypothetical protein